VIPAPTTSVAGAPSDVVLRPPQVTDAAAVLDLVVRSSRLDRNSAYHYLLLCRDFAGTSVVAEVDGRVVGFVTGYLRPAAPDTYFAWQSAVDSAVPVPGLALAMMIEVVDRAQALGARRFETTVNPDNRAVIMLVRKLARRHGATVTTSVLFDEADLGPDHDVEVLYRFPLRDGQDPDHPTATTARSDR
jgi:L-2,4-diaminobutyric acid acetyltransferase